MTSPNGTEEMIETSMPRLDNLTWSGLTDTAQDRLAELIGLVHDEPQQVSAFGNYIGS